MSLAPGTSYSDLDFLGHRNAIAAGTLSAPSGVAIVDPGPPTYLTSLENSLQAQGNTRRDVRTILLTPIHLDDAGGTGTILARNPHIEVFVHERGAAHLIDPGRLVASATRYVGPANMERLWGARSPRFHKTGCPAGGR
jgi:glyoxylase-like metal-dependent hydrolase (beta-lactamase superfamily II)